MHDDTINASADPIVSSVLLRPFARGTVLAYELVLKRAQGSRVYDRSLGYLNGADARDLANVCPTIKFAESNPT